MSARDSGRYLGGDARDGARDATLGGRYLEVVLTQVKARRVRARYGVGADLRVGGATGLWSFARSASSVSPMNVYGFLILVHLIGASVWVGGHLVLACTILPRAWRARDVDALRRFESAYERIGVPALLAQVVSGVWLAYLRLPDIGAWADWSNPVARLISIKLGLLVATLILGVDARVRLIPRLRADNVTALAWHILPVTAISVLLLAVGATFRTGWLF